jgi:predicted MFS family arabinose efflux permease
MWLVGLAVFAAGLSTTLPLPLYVEYAAGGGTGALAAAFACYAGILILTAPLLGPLPDRIGRRPCMLLGLALAGCSTLLLALWPGVLPLALARCMQGVAMGCISNAAGAWAAELAERDGAARDVASRQGARMVAAGTAGSFGAGSLFTLINLLLAPDARPPVVFWAHLVLLAGVLVAVSRLPETRAGLAGATLRLPLFPRGTLASTMAMVPGWGVTGVVLSTVPVALAALGHPRAGAWVVAGMILAGTATQQVFRAVEPRRALRIGLPLLCLGAGLVFLGAVQGWLWLLLLGGPLTGMAAYGLVYLGGLAAATAAAPDDRPRATAGFFVIAHLGFSAVPLVVGLAADAFGSTLALAGMWCFVLAATVALLPRLRGR